MSTGPINFRAPAMPAAPAFNATELFQPPPAPAQAPAQGGPALTGDANNALAAQIMGPAAPGAPIGAPSYAKSAPAEKIIQMAEKLLGKPLSDEVKFQVTMQAGAMSTAQVVKNLLTTPGIASSLAQRALGLFKGGKISSMIGSFFKGKAPALIKVGQGLLKPGGLMEKLKGLKESFNVPSLSGIKLPSLASLFGPKPAAT